MINSEAIDPLLSTKRSWVLRYLVAIAVVAFAAGLRIWPLGALELRLAWVTFTPAVMAAALYGGFGCGILATVLTVVTVYFWSPTGQPFIDDPGDWLGVGVFSFNGTLISLISGMMHRARDRSARLKDQADAANKAKSAFLAGMSHELRTPLNAIMGFSRLMARDDSLSEMQQDRLNIINRSGEHLLTMINDVLDISKIEAGQEEWEAEVFDLPLMLQEIGRMFAVRAETASLHLRVKLDPALPQFIETDAGKLRQILINLLGNAVKFTSEGEISLRALSLPIEDDPSKVTLQIEVQDCGRGIAPEQLKSIFQPFVQGEQGESDHKGTGLGLAISKSFANMLGGEISAESEQGRGSTFRVHFPVALAEAVVTEAPRPEVLGLEPGQPAWRILVVEDNAENRLLLGSILREAGFEVQEAENGEVAIARFEQWQPHFIWLDIRMPVMDGYQAAAKIRTLPGGDRVKIVALTASVYVEQHEGILKAGCDLVVHKPFQTHAIFDTMEQQLGVRYVYGEDKPEASAATAPSTGSALSPEHLALLPAELPKELRDALVLLDVQQINSIIERITEHDPAMGAEMKSLAKSFNYEKIQKLLVSHIEKVDAQT
jgi:signal transduction histidine kinase/CheY-like chemotaxis protein